MAASINFKNVQKYGIYRVDVYSSIQIAGICAFSFYPNGISVICQQEPTFPHMKALRLIQKSEFESERWLKFYKIILDDN